MKKIIIAVILIAATVFIPMQKAHAITGIATGNVPMALIGLTSPYTSYVTMAVITNNTDCDSTQCMLGTYFAGIFIGLVLLEDQSEVQFSSLTSDQAKKMNIDTEALQTYNDEIEQVNMIFEEVAQSLDSDSTELHARELWQDYKEYVSPSTFKIMQTVN